MPQISYRANLSAAIFPLSLSAAGRTTIIPGPDNNFDRRVDPEGEQKDAGIPQAIYMENVIPTAHGYQSIGFRTLANIPVGAGSYIYRTAIIGSQVYVFTAGLTEKVFRSPLADGVTWQDYTAAWGALFGNPYIEGFLPYNNLSIATIRGTTYVFVRNGQALAEVTSGTWINCTLLLTGIDATDVQCILSSHNYLIAVMEDKSIAWSSTTTPLDFTSSLVTGAGRTIPNAVRTNIVAAHNCPEGFILYTEDTAILASYTGNARYPWKFTEIPGSSGRNSERKITAPVDAPVHLILDNHGNIKQISANGAAAIAPEVSTYLRHVKVPQDLYNKTTAVFSSSENTLSPYQINLFLNRYILLSFHTNPNTGTGNYPHAFTLVYDINLKRYGKINGSCSYYWATPSALYGVSTIGVVQEVLFNIHDVTNATFDSVLALGKFQHVRARRMELEQVSVDGEVPVLNAAVAPSHNGADLLPAIPLTYRYEDTEHNKTFAARTEGLNVTVVLTGRFNISSVDLKFQLGGGR